MSHVDVLREFQLLFQRVEALAPQVALLQNQVVLVPAVDLVIARLEECHVGGFQQLTSKL